MRWIWMWLLIATVTAKAESNQDTGQPLPLPPPAPPVLILKGLDAKTNEECVLTVVEIGEQVPPSRAGQRSVQRPVFFARVRTSYSHNGEEPDEFRIGPTPNHPAVLSGRGAHPRENLAVFLSSQGTDLRLATRFHLNWWHRNHVHTERCLGLKVHEEPAPEPAPEEPVPVEPPDAEPKP